MSDAKSQCRKFHGNDFISPDDCFWLPQLNRVASFYFYFCLKRIEFKQDKSATFNKRHFGNDAAYLSSHQSPTPAKTGSSGMGLITCPGVISSVTRLPANSSRQPICSSADFHALNDSLSLTR